jgi:quercetin dioxygenase-like cupin family protein
MKLKSITLIGFCFILAGGVAIAAADDSVGVVHLVSQQPLASQPGTDVTVITVDYPPGAATPPHEHPGYTYAYVLEGSVISQINDAKPQTYSQGQMWTEQPHDRHMVSKNASKTAPARLLVFMIAPHGAKLTTMLPSSPTH